MNERFTLLYIDDELSNLKTFKAVFKWDYNIHIAQSAAEGLQVLSESTVDLIIADQRMPLMSGYQFFRNIADKYPEPIRIILTGYSDMDVLVKAINECGIYQYLTKPWSEKEMKYVLDKALEIYQLRKDNKRLLLDLQTANSQLKAENYYLKEEIQLENNFNNLVTESERFKKILKKVEAVGNTNTTVLVTGESGTGKELVARAVHNISDRKHKPLIKINCAALPKELIESELFGHEKGAFTGAHQSRKGKFELAHQSSIFLDEIGEMPIGLQAKLLRVLQEGEVERLGGEKVTKVDVRVIAATNRNLEEAIKNGSFREDLYYRLNVFPIECIPLRERKEDIPLLVKFFINKLSGPLNKKITTISKQVMNRFLAYHWPGNVRELENLIERSMILSDGLGLLVEEPLLPKVDRSRLLSLRDNEKQHIQKVLKITNGKISGMGGAAEMLNINPKTLYSRMQKLGLTDSGTADI